MNRSAFFWHCGTHKCFSCHTYDLFVLHEETCRWCIWIMWLLRWLRFCLLQLWNSCNVTAPARTLQHAAVKKNGGGGGRTYTNSAMCGKKKIDNRDVQLCWHRFIPARQTPIKCNYITCPSTSLLEKWAWAKSEKSITCDWWYFLFKIKLHQRGVPARCAWQ